MKLKYQDIEIPENDPFKFCKLKRKPYAEALTSVLNTFGDNFVLSINNPWGTGKTTFIKMWKQNLSNEGFNTLYFNAWESDFESDPLVALMSELQTLTEESDKTFKSLIKNGSKITQKILPALVKAIAEKYIDTKILIDAIENVTTATSEILKDEINEYATKKQGLKDFRKDLAKFLSEHNNAKPLIFFIDELDRCKPDYAVEVLEKVKHFFNVQGIIFVLSIDKLQLTHAVKGYYGSEKIDGDEYLRRFIDVEYNIPSPDQTLFIKYLYNFLEFDTFFFSTERSQIQEFQEDSTNFLKFITIVVQKSNLTLRQQEKFFLRVKLVIASVSSNFYFFPGLTLTLIFLKEYHTEIYNKLRARTLQPQSILDEILPVFKNKIDDDNIRSYILVEAQLTVFYTNYYTEINYKYKTYQKEENGEQKSLVKSKMDNEGNLIFNGFIDWIYRENYSSLMITKLLDRIDLLNNLSSNL